MLNRTFACFVAVRLTVLLDPLSRAYTPTNCLIVHIILASLQSTSAFTSRVPIQTTLLKLLLCELTPTEGEINHHSKLKVHFEIEDFCLLSCNLVGLLKCSGGSLSKSECFRRFHEMNALPRIMTLPTGRQVPPALRRVASDGADGIGILEVGVPH